MTDPTPLSPAAEAVLDAYWKAPCSNKRSVAAALRAAAQQLTFEDSLAGPVISPRELLDIADELENHAN